MKIGNNSNYSSAPVQISLRIVEVSFINMHRFMPPLALCASPPMSARALSFSPSLSLSIYLSLFLLTIVKKHQPAPATTRMCTTKVLSSKTTRSEVATCNLAWPCHSNGYDEPCLGQFPLLLDCRSGSLLNTSQEKVEPLLT